MEQPLWKHPPKRHWAGCVLSLHGCSNMKIALFLYKNQWRLWRSNGDHLQEVGIACTRRSMPIPAHVCEWFKCVYLHILFIPQSAAKKHSVRLQILLFRTNRWPPSPWRLCVALWRTQTSAVWRFGVVSGCGNFCLERPCRLVFGVWDSSWTLFH